MAKLVKQAVRYQVRDGVPHQKASERVIALRCQEWEGQDDVGSMGFSAPSLGVVDVNIPDG